MQTFAHYNAFSVKEALDILDDYCGEAILNAGGTDLLGLLKDRSLSKHPKALVNIKTIPDLTFINEKNDAIIIGALTTLAEIINSPLISEQLPALGRAASSVAGPQIQNMATIGGNICQDTRCWYYRYPHELGGRIRCFRKGGKICPAVTGDNRYHAIMGAKKCYSVCISDMAVCLTAMNATFVLHSGVGSREIPAQEFYTPMGNVLAQGEMVTAVKIPKISSNTYQDFVKFTLRQPIDFSVVSVSSLIVRDGKTCVDSRIVMGAVAYAPVRALASEDMLKGCLIDDDIAAKAAEIALSEAKPLKQNAYKIQIAKTLIKRTITGAMSEASLQVG